MAKMAQATNPPPVPSLALAGGCGQRLNLTVSLKLREITSFGQRNSTVDNEHKEAKQAECIEECFPLPHLIIVVKLDGSVQSFIKKVYAVGYNILGKVGPRVCYCRVENNTYSFFPVYFLGIISLAGSGLKAGGINAEIKE